MTIDETSDEWLQQVAHSLADCSGPGPCAQVCPRIFHALKATRDTALAAEREQHARDVAEARAETWRAAARELRDVESASRDTARRHGRNRAPLAASSCLTVAAECDGLAKDFEARAQALNDSRPPSGINQGSGAGEAYAELRALGPLCAHGLYKSRCERCGAEPLNANVAPSPASPTGETRDEPPATHASLETRLAVAAMTPKWPVQPASAPGGAPGVETRVTHADVAPGTTWSGSGSGPVVVRSLGDVCRGSCCDHHDGHRRVLTDRGEFCSQLISWCWRKLGTGTTPTPSIETPTGGRG